MLFLTNVKARFQSSGPNGRHLKNPKITDKCMVARLGWTDYHTFVSYFQVFQMSVILRHFGQQLWNLAALLILTCSLSWWGSFLWLMKFNLCWLAAAIFRIGLWHAQVLLTSAYNNWAPVHIWKGCDALIMSKIGACPVISSNQFGRILICLQLEEYFKNSEF